MTFSLYFEKFQGKGFPTSVVFGAHGGSLERVILLGFPSLLPMVLKAILPDATSSLLALSD